jgi:hypothetical protein
MTNTREILAGIRDALVDALGYPATLCRLLEETPSLREAIAGPAPLADPARTISSRSVVRWEEWGGATHHPFGLRRGELMGWRYGRTWHSFTEVRDDLANFVPCEKTEDWMCDIQAVQGLSASKSPLGRFASLHEMAGTNCKPLITLIREPAAKEASWLPRMRVAGRASGMSWPTMHWPRWPD